MSTASTIQKLELAAQALLITKALGYPVYTGITSGDKEGPCVILVGAKGPEDPLDSGNYKLKLRVCIKGIPEPDAAGLTEFQTLCGAVSDVFKAYTIADDLTTALPNFTAIGVVDQGPDSSVDETVWVEEQAFMVYCCGSALT